MEKGVVKTAVALLATALLLTGSEYAFAQATEWNEIDKLVAADREEFARFSWSVSFSGDYAIVGAPGEGKDANGANPLSNAGAAYVFQHSNGAWQQVQKLVASDRDSIDSFGSAVAISGDYAIVGAPNEDEDAAGGNTLTGAGSAYIFKNNNGNWEQVNKIVAADRGAEDGFGSSVAISGTRAIVGARNEDEDAAGGNTLTQAGSAYIFKNNNGSWEQVNKIVAADRGADDLFGTSVAISGDYAIVGASFEDEDLGGGNTLTRSGSAYIFQRGEDTSGRETWGQMQKIVADDRAAGDQFGQSVAISGTHAIISALFEDEDAAGANTLTNAGSAYIFQNNSGTWEQLQKIVAADRASSDRFGQAVAISGDYAIVGAFLEDEDPTGGNTLSRAGSAYIFQNDNGMWQQGQKIVASDRDSHDFFGYSVAISGERAIVGAYPEEDDATGGNSLSNAGSAYMFEIPVLNNPPTDISLSNATVAENLPAGTVVGFFETTDADTGDTHTYSLVSGTGDEDNAFFVIGGDTLKSNAVFDTETKDSYSIRVQTADSSAATFEKQFTITITNENEPPIVANPIADIEVDEDAPDTILDLSAVFTDPDEADSLIVKTIVANSDSSVIIATINGDSLTLTHQPNQHGSATIAVRATSNGMSIDDDFTVTVTPVNDPPTAILLSDVAIGENLPAGTVVGFFETTDADTGDTHTYSLVSGTGDEDNASFVMVDDTLKSNAVFDTETKDSYSIRVQTADSSAATFEKQFTITIINENEPPIVANAMAEVQTHEDAPDTTLDLSAVFTDPDDADSLIVKTIVANSDSSLIIAAINGDSLTLTYQPNQHGSATITVRATSNGMSIDHDFNVAVTPVNDPPTKPTLLAPSMTDSLSSTEAPVEFLWSAAQDVDGDSLSYTLKLFAASSTTLVPDLTDTTYQFQGLTFVTETMYQWVVEVSDQMMLVVSDTASFEVVIVSSIAGTEELPDSYTLFQNYPNPFNPTTSIRYDLPEAADVKIHIYDIRGRFVTALVDQRQEAGRHSVLWNGRDQRGRRAATGVYIYRLVAGDQVFARKMLLIK